jgi:Uma2 family endonuclease
MTWNEVIADPSLHDLPYKIELNRRGQIIMSPASSNHAKRQGRIAGAIVKMMTSGEMHTESPIDTDRGVKVADVVWMSDAYFAAHEDETPLPISPELCVEVISLSNSRREINEKKALYFSQGAREVWFSKQDGTMLFFTPEGEIAQSQLFPDFPKTV